MGWDEKSVYIGQEFFRNNTTVAKVMIDARFVTSGGKRVDTADIVELFGVDQPSPELPGGLRQWIDSRKTNESLSHDKPLQPPP